MKTDTDLADALQARLADHAAGVMPSPLPGARAAVDDRVAVLTTRRRRRRAAGAGLALLVVLGAGAAGVASRGGDRLSTTPAAPPAPTVPEPEPAVAPAPPGPFALAGERFVLSGASDDPVEGSASAGGYLQTFHRDESPESPILFVTSVPPGTPYGIGKPGVVDDTPGRMPSLGWHTPDGGTVSLRGWRLTGADLAAARDALVRRTDGRPGFDAVAPLPGGVGPAVEGPLHDAGGRYTEATYTADGVTIDVRQFSGDEIAMRTRLLDRLDTAEDMRFGTVRGRHAFVVLNDRQTTAVWFDDGRLVGEVVVESADTALVKQVLDAVVAVDDETAWQAMVAR